MTSRPEAVTVYYDGLCQLCSREINHYRHQVGHENILFLDITTPDFDALGEGVDPVQVHKVMHAKNAEGVLLTKVDAFIAIWEQLPRYRWAAGWARRPLVKKLLETGYTGFALVRPYLPKKKRDCESSPYCEVGKDS